jgi:hypothetical protein
MGSAPSVDCAAMRADIKEFLKVFGFQYSVSQWAEIERAIKAQPGEHDIKEIRETLEREAHRYRVVPQLEAKTQRGDINFKYAKKVAQACEHLKRLLAEPAYSRDYSLADLVSPSECDTIVDALKRLRGKAEAIAANNRPLSQKNRRADPHRDKYLGTLCDLWVNTIHGPTTTSYRRAKGEASGPFVDFIFLVARPVLGQFTPNGAASFIKRWRKTETMAV